MAVDKWREGSSPECQDESEEIAPMDAFTEGRRIHGVDLQFAYTDPRDETP